MPRAGRGFPSEPLIRPEGARSAASANASITVGIPLFTPPNPTVAITISGNGTIAAIVKKGAISPGVALSGSGSITVTSARLSILIPPTFVVGGGGRIAGRSAPARGVVNRGILLPRVDTQAANTSVAFSGNGSIFTSATKNASSSISISSHGSITVDATKSLILLPMMVMGGGGRLGRSMPVRPYVALPSVIPIQAGVKTGSVTISGNGSISVAGSKSIVSSSEILGFPPIFQNFIGLTITISGGGQITVTGFAQSSNRAGSVTIIGNGNIAVSTSAGHPASEIVILGFPPILWPNFVGAAHGVSITGTGALTLTGGKSEASGVSISGNGFTNIIGKRSPQQAITLSATGTQSVTGKKGGLRGVSVSGGGTITLQTNRSAPRIVAISGNGQVSVSGRKNSLSVVGLSANGSLNIGILHLVSISMSGQGRLILSGRKGVSGSSAISGNGQFALSAQKRMLFGPTISGRGNIAAQGHISLDFVDTANITGSGGITTTGRKRIATAAPLSGRGRIVIISVREFSSQSVILTGGGTINAEGHKIPDKPFYGRTKVYTAPRRSRIQSW